MKLHLFMGTDEELSDIWVRGQILATSLCGKTVQEYTTDKAKFRRSRNRCGACMRSAVASWGWRQRGSTKPIQQDREAALARQKILAPNARQTACKLTITLAAKGYINNAFCEGCGFTASAQGVSCNEARPLFRREHAAFAERMKDPAFAKFHEKVLQGIRGPTRVEDKQEPRP